MERAVKSIQTAYIFWVFSGLLAGHRFYIGGWRLAWSLLTLTGGATLLLIAAIGYSDSFSVDTQNTMGGMAVILALFGFFLVVIDLALIPGLVRAENEESGGQDD